jgi:BlaI family transcriptional regulator, penicillinase repressor
MERLTRKEEEAMKILWKSKKGFIKELLDLYKDPKPNYNSLSNLIRSLEDKGFVKHKAYGKNHQYYPAISKEEYRKTFMKAVVSDYFGSSYKNVVSFIIDEKKINREELKAMIEIIEKGKNNE